MKWFLKAAEQGDANAQYNPALLYSKGEGATQSVAVSFFIGTILVHFGRVVRKRSGLEGSKPNTLCISYEHNWPAWIEWSIHYYRIRRLRLLRALAVCIRALSAVA